MSHTKRHLVTLPAGTLSIIEAMVDDDDPTLEAVLVKTLFELSRDADLTTHFDPDIHTREVIAAAGLSGHVALSSRTCEETDLPAERVDIGIRPTFRDAWVDTGSAVEINMPKARVIHLGRIRAIRDRELAALDVPFMRAVEVGDSTEQARIGTDKQTLRDIPQSFPLDGYATSDALKAAWPDGLPTS